MYEFPVHDCAQEQNGSPYFSSIVRQCKWPSSSRRIVEIQKLCYHGNLTSRFPLILGWVSWCERGFWQIVKQWACETILLCLLLPSRSLNLAVSSLLIIWNNATNFCVHHATVLFCPITVTNWTIDVILREPTHSLFVSIISFCFVLYSKWTLSYSHSD